MAALKEKIKERLPLALTLFLLQLGLILFVRTQLWLKATIINKTIISLASISSHDALVAVVASTILTLLLRKNYVLLFGQVMLAACLFFPVFFQLKMEIPLSLGLVSQIGGVFELKTSIADQSNLRNFVIFTVIMTGAILALGLVIFFIQRFRRVMLAGCLAGFILTVFFAGLKVSQNENEENLSYSFLLELFGNRPGNKKLSALKVFEHITLKPPGRNVIHSEQTSSKPNIILVILETFDYSFIQDELEFKSVMPNLHRRSGAATHFPAHYAPWPFSSKSLYSIFCGEYPYPGKVIDLRIMANINCKGWSASLEAGGYQLWAAYSGDLAYDRMGEFMRHQGKYQLEDRHTLSRFKLEEWGLGVDDQALVMAFEEFLKKRDTSKPFAGVFIPINSHHPYWVPSHAKNEIQDSFRSSFRYQDQVLENLFVLLEKQNILKDSVIIVTGDHGRREGLTKEPGSVPETMYHVPLMVFNGINLPSKITHATSHLDLKGSILRFSGTSGEIIQDYHLGVPKDFMVIYDLEHFSFLLKTKEQDSLVLSVNHDRAYKGESWVEEQKKECEPIMCDEKLQVLKGLIQEAKSHYDRL